MPRIARGQPLSFIILHRWEEDFYDRLGETNPNFSNNGKALYCFWKSSQTAIEDQVKGSPAHPAAWIWISQRSNKDQRAKILPFLVPHLTASETMVEALPRK